MKTLPSTFVFLVVLCAACGSSKTTGNAGAAGTSGQAGAAAGAGGTMSQAGTGGGAAGTMGSAGTGGGAGGTTGGGGAGGTTGGGGAGGTGGATQMSCTQMGGTCPADCTSACPTGTTSVVLSCPIVPSNAACGGMNCCLTDKSYYCGTETCTTGQTFCHVISGGVPGSGQSRSCTKVPAACSDSPTCACLCPPVDPVTGCRYRDSLTAASCSCTERNGQVTISCVGS